MDLSFLKWRNASIKCSLAYLCFRHRLWQSHEIFLREVGLHFLQLAVFVQQVGHPDHVVCRRSVLRRVDGGDEGDVEIGGTPVPDVQPQVLDHVLPDFGDKVADGAADGGLEDGLPGDGLQLVGGKGVPGLGPGGGEPHAFGDRVLWQDDEAVEVWVRSRRNQGDHLVATDMMRAPHVVLDTRWHRSPVKKYLLIRQFVTTRA